MSDLPLISVIIPAYNAADCIATAVASAQAQTYQPLEILVINDGSTDNTSSVLSNLPGHVRVLQQANAGPAAARNHGLRMARGELVAFLDADDRWVPEKLALQWELLRDRHEVGLVHTNVIYFDAHTGQEWQRELGRERFVGDCSQLLLLENRILASSVLVRRSCLEQVGPFDEQFKGVEDYDLWLRVSHSCQFAYLEQPLVYYQQQAGSLSTYSAAMRAGELRVVRKALLPANSIPARTDAAPNSQALKHRLQELSYGVGYDAFAKGELREARRMFGDALHYAPFKLRTACLWCATWLPAGLIGTLRRWKARGSGQKAVSSN